MRIPNQDPEAIARGNAFVATANNPAAIYYNPAGITQLDGNNVQLGSLFYLNVYADYQSPSGGKVKNEPEVIPVPSLHYSYTPKGSPLSFGLGVYAPFGLSMKWPDSAPFATGGLEGKLTYITAAPVAALKLHRTLSIAVGPTFNQSDLLIRQRVGFVPGDEFKFDGEDIGFGYTAGVLWQPVDQWSFGLSYKSGVGMKYEGRAALHPLPPLAGSFDSSAPLDFPQIIAGGVSYRPNKDWNFEFDVDWTDWNSVNRLAVKGVPARKLNWEASFFYEAGVTRYLSGGYFLSAGYFYSERSTSERYFIPNVPDTDLHVGSLGGGYHGRHWRFAIASQIIAGPWRTINSNANPSVKSV